MKKLLLSLVFLAIMGLSNVFAQQKIFYLKGKTSPYNIYSANLDGTGEVLIATGALDAGYGGGKICFYTDYTGIKYVNAIGNGLSIIPNTSDIGQNTELDFSPDGSKIVYTSSANNFKQFIINIDGTGKETFNDGSGTSKHQDYPSWNEAGKIYFGLSDYGNAYSQLIYSKPDNDSTATPTQLTTSFGQYPASGGPSKKVVYNDLAGNLIVMNHDGTNKTQLISSGSGNYYHKAWDTLTGYIYYINGGNLWKVKYDDTGNTQITTEDSIYSVLGIDAVCYNTIYQTVYDTVHIAVTDTLIINAVLTGINPPSNINTIKVYPNPAKDHIYIFCGNYTSMNGYQIKIINTLSQTVFQTNISQQSYCIDLSTFNGTGTYFLQIYDNQSHLIDVRKIILQ